MREIEEPNYYFEVQETLEGNQLPQIQIQREPFLRKISKKFKNFIISIFFLIFKLVQIVFEVLVNPILWLTLNTIFSISMEVFVYIVLGIATILIHLIYIIQENYVKSSSEKELCPIGRKQIS